MFDGIVAQTGVCGHCGKRRMLASIPELARDHPWGDEPEGAVIDLCAGCIYKLTRLAGLLLRLEAVPAGKAKRAPKKARKLRTTEPEPVLPHRDGVEHVSRILVPETDQLSP